MSINGYLYCHLLLLVLLWNAHCERQLSFIVQSIISRARMSLNLVFLSTTYKLELWANCSTPQDPNAINYEVGIIMYLPDRSMKTMMVNFMCQFGHRYQDEALFLGVTVRIFQLRLMSELVDFIDQQIFLPTVGGHHPVHRGHAQNNRQAEEGGICPFSPASLTEL